MKQIIEHIHKTILDETISNDEKRQLLNDYENKIHLMILRNIMSSDEMRDANELIKHIECIEIPE